MAIGDPYITRDKLKDVLDITDDSEDDWIDRCVLGASRALERRSGWPTFWNTVTPVTRTFSVVGRVRPVRTNRLNFDKILLRDGIASAEGLLVAGVSNPILMPEEALDEGMPCDAIRLPSGAVYDQMTLTAIRGYPSVPADIEWAAQMQSQRFYGRKGSPEGIAGSAEWGLTRIPALDPDVLAILKGGGFMRAGIG